jgi:hypothetical protein
MLDDKVLHLLRADSIHWLDFPFGTRGKGQDDEWTGVDFVGQKSVQTAWHRFWPQTGNVQNWDAVARVKSRAGSEWLLVEAKSHLGEIQTSCGAKARGGRGQIVETMDEVKKALGVPSEADWLNGYYQFCNRVAALYFLLRKARIPARLLFIYFTGDSFPGGRTKCPKTEAQWLRALDAQKKQVALPAKHALSDRIHQLFLPVGGV